jgi:beta-phosphoglucomutase
MRRTILTVLARQTVPAMNGLAKLSFRVKRLISMDPIHDNRHALSPAPDFLRQHNLLALFWDWDGVSVDSSPNYYRAYELVLRDAGIAATPREIYLREGQPTPPVLRAIFEQRGIPASDSLIRQLVERRREYDAAIGECRFVDAVSHLLHRLRAAGYRLGIVTGSSRKSVQRVLTPDHADLFDVTITADDVVRSKPHSDRFLRAAEALHINPGNCLVVENAPFGIEAARAAGCRVVAICTTLSREDLSREDWIVENHRELETPLLPLGPPVNTHMPIPATQEKP